KGEYKKPCILDAKEVPLITAYLFHAGGHEDPERLLANTDKSFQGSILLGMGFTFDDTDTSGVASPLAVMRDLIGRNPRNAERILPYIGGEEVNSSPTQSHNRYAINFGMLGEDEARRGWPDLMRIVEERVKPQREDDKREVRRKYWWRYGETTPALHAAIAKLKRVLVVNCGATPHMSFAWLDSRMVFANSLDIFVFENNAAFCALQSRVHEVWVRFFASSLEDRLRYTPSDCFETFPFPREFETSAALEEAGKAYYEFRADMMVRNNEGLTKTYNRFHAPDETSPDILRLRELHGAMDRTVLDAYDWTDIRPTCEFLLDYEEEDDEEESSGRSCKRPWRYRFPDEIRDEVLARLLKLNAERAAEECRSGLAAAAKARKTKGKRGRKKKAAKSGDPSLLDTEE
ncbi:MAG TPA: type IIL restriction-modification enzyme MmeI, partial [Phycisphaerae bacterium]|nr:type IIL restriction-modification enzyme MmeI [Phycisphaerae bacterium]